MTDAEQKQAAYWLHHDLGWGSRRIARAVARSRDTVGNWIYPEAQARYEASDKGRARHARASARYRATDKGRARYARHDARRAGTLKRAVSRARSHDRETTRRLEQRLGVTL